MQYGMREEFGRFTDRNSLMRKTKGNSPISLPPIRYYSLEIDVLAPVYEIH